MPKKKIDTRLHDLFAALEEQDRDATLNPAQERDVRDAARTLLLELETRPAAGDELAGLPEVIPPPRPEPAPASQPPSLPIIYEQEEVGYTYSGNELSPFQGAPELSNAVLTPLIDSGQPIGSVVIERDPSQPWSEEEQSLLDAIAQQVSLQIQNLRLLSSTERARAEAQSATRQFIHQSWDSYLDGIHQNERLGFAYDQKRVEPCVEPATAELDVREPVKVLDEPVGELVLKADDNQPLSGEDRELVAAVARQVGQQVENLRLLADAARARAQAEEATRQLTREGWKEFAKGAEDLVPAYVYDLNQVAPLEGEPENIRYRQPLVVRGETIGELAVADVQEISPEATGLMAEIAMQTSIHLETLRLNEELRKRAEELQELDRLKSSFLANMSHELRTPLNSILGFSDVILEGIDGPLTDYMENDLKLIQKNGLHLLHLINDVLDMAKIESGRMNLHPEKLNVNDVFVEVISITSSLANEKHLDVHIAPDSSPALEIVADVTRLRQVLINMVNNSIKFTEQGSVTLRVDELENDFVMISIKDTGIGIPPDHLEPIFEEFSQVDTTTTRKVGGTGLGLPISRRLVEMHGGRMWAESKNIPGEGSTFFVVLPRVAVVNEPVEALSKK